MQGAGSSAFAVCGGCSRYHLQRVDLIAGGFPCQDISVAGKGVGLDGERSGLWFEYLRIVQELRPTWVLAENVPALRTRGADTVLDGLAAAGYSCWPLVVGARHVGAPHRRDRVWIVAHASRDESERRRGSEDVADCDGIGRDGQWGGWLREGQRIDGQEAVGGRDVDGCHRWPSRPGTAQYDWEEPRTVESPLGGAAYGLSERLAGRHRRNALKALGNSVVPQVVEAIGRAILEAA